MKSIIQIDDDKCANCGRAFGSEWHHIFQGNPNRNHSEDDGLKIRLCHECHDKLHFDPYESGPLEAKWHRLGQEKWEAYYGWKLELEGKDPREEFRKRYGKSWL